MKRIMFFAVVAFLVGCDYYGGLEPISKPYYGQFISSQLYEDENGDVFAKINLLQSEDIPIYLSAELYIDGVSVGIFKDRIIYYYPSLHGEVQCKIIFTLNSGEKILFDWIKI